MTQPVVLLSNEDLAPFATIDDDKATQMIADAVGLATISAPCLGTPDTLTSVQLAATKAVLRRAVLRWNEEGSGAVVTQSMGGLTVTEDTTQPRRSMFWPSEITDLQKICKGGNDGGAFAVDTAPPGPILFHTEVPAYRTNIFTGGQIFEADIEFESGDTDPGFL